MKLSRKWLNEYVDLSLSECDDRSFAEAMTVSGSKVEVTEDLSRNINNVKVGRIVSMAKHPNSDHMLVCQIDIGGETVQICTGAWNVHVGDLVPAALHNSLLPGGVKITKGKLRGVESDGMLCSLKELNVTTHDFPYAVIEPAAILGDYHPIDPAKPSISADIKAGDKIYGKVIAARVEKLETLGYSRYRLSLDTGKGSTETVTGCQNIHEGDLLAYDTGKDKVCTLQDLHAEQREFPHCINDGIFIINEDCKPGDDMALVLGMDDHVVEFEITPNRPDCLCMIGLAREAAVTFGKELKLHEPVVKATAQGNIRDMAKIVVEEPELCPRYTARMVRNVKIAPSPAWMRERIRNAGMRPINNVVDITNYVMLEYGQPMHAFDFSCVNNGEIHVRLAREGETIQTLDGNERKLSTSMLCICDTDKPVGVAGVMGGANSEIEGDTAMVLFESANFNGASIRRTATALGMRTDASSRYEKGLDVENTYKAVERACELIELLGAGEVVEGVIDVVPKKLKETTVKLEPEKINALLGTDIAEEEMRRILLHLGFTLEGDIIHVPSWRGDVEHYSDIAEEVARFYGYNEIPTCFAGGNTTSGGFSPVQLCERQAGQTCRSLGMDEIITYSFISPSYYDKIRMPADSPLRDSLRILNPLGEDTSIMRTTVLPSMLEILSRNYNYRNRSAALYEIGKIYLKRDDGMADEPKIVSIGAYGPEMDFFKLKGWVEALLEEMKLGKLRFEAEKENPSYHPGRCAKVYAGDSYVGVLGQIHPAVAENYGVDTELYCAELSFEAIFALQGGTPVYTPLPKFPSVTRDIAVVCDRDIPVGRLLDCIMENGGEYLKDCSVFDVYTGSHIAPGKKSVAFSLTMRSDDQTLTDEHAGDTVKAVLSALEKNYGAVIR
ncbi:MAG TPA: phenylalanine--tRNA ligase subunit beta [Candidatus Limivicinus faecipullorum]|nr:phenylalanine--tRNA ligase subunit beta [Candidatus Limivicinus faecipullorum]